MNPELRRECRETLRQILEYVGADLKYADYAQLHSYLEWFLAHTRPDMLLNESERRCRNAGLDHALSARSGDAAAAEAAQAEQEKTDGN